MMATLRRATTSRGSPMGGSVNDVDTTASASKNSDEENQTESLGVSSQQQQEQMPATLLPQATTNTRSKNHCNGSGSSNGTRKHHNHHHQAQHAEGILMAPSSISSNLSITNKSAASYLSEASSYNNNSTAKSASSWHQPPPSPIGMGPYNPNRTGARGGFRLESTASDFETDVVVQQAQSKMLREKQHLAQLQRHNSLDGSGRGRLGFLRRRRSYYHHHGSTTPGGGPQGGGGGGGSSSPGGAAELKSVNTPSQHASVSKTVLVSLLIFLVLTGAGIAIGVVIGNAQFSQIEKEASQLAKETGQFFSEQLDKAILPLFSMAQFATHLQMFQDLPTIIGPAGAPGSLPLNTTSWKRNITGVCDDPELVETFVDIATNIKRQSGMDGILANIQLAPHGVICLLHPLNNTEDFPDGMYLDNTPVWGLDLFEDPGMKYIALQSIPQEEVGIAGPLTLKQCPECDPFLIARLPVIDPRHTIRVDGKSYNRWGFATALIAWAALVEQSGVYDDFATNEFEFRLTRTDYLLNTQTIEYEEKVVILAETANFAKHESWKTVSTSLETTNNEWVMTVAYDQKPINQTVGFVIGSCVVVAFFIAVLVYIVLNQKHEHADMLAVGYVQEARVATERNMTAYFAHELRNPLSALDSALSSITTNDLPESTRELLDGMQLCSSFMSSIMNNLLDVRKIEEGKMRIRAKPLSLSNLLDNTHTMMKFSVRPGVKFSTVKDLPPGKTWVLGDEHRIQQVLTNVITNAIKYTLQGSITLSVYWKGDFVVLDCEDTGPGIPKSEQTRMFERFVQRGGAPGTGLGLNIAQQIVHIMEGTIGFESDPTVAPGTTCRIELPLVVCDDPEFDEDERGIVAAKTSGIDRDSKASSCSSPRSTKKVQQEVIEDSITILLIDDIKMNRTMLSRRIQKAIAPNATIVLAETAERALELCEDREFDVIICDQYMEEAGGVMVGTDAIIAMRRMDVTAYIIGCSGNDLDAEFYDAGADMVWGKPLPQNGEIIRQLRHGLEASRSRQ